VNEPEPSCERPSLRPQHLALRSGRAQRLGQPGKLLDWSACQTLQTPGLLEQRGERLSNKPAQLCELQLIVCVTGVRQ
jgi:hypothetical protein